ncbi:pilus assembly protein TadG-related protein [Mesorhizobium sp. CAU 1732]|uniref:pilus assembly protein TadG-related protein n=1 Tax=Mesorhizobium sp. CAU 1732 TaxID=3140358 RepID=UPI0032604422
MTAIIMPVAITLAAFAVDAGSLYVEKRRAQGLADLAAITAAANIDKAAEAALIAMHDNGATAVTLSGATTPTDEEDEDEQHGAGEQGEEIIVVRGQYVADPAVPADLRFTPGAKPENAVQVTYRTTGTRYFAGALIPPPKVTTTAIASASTQAAFSIGSRLAALNGGIVNGLLSGLTGSTISLSVMDYNALLSADVSLLTFLRALAIDLELTAATYEDVLDTEVTIGQIGRALSKMSSLDGNAKAAASRLSSQATTPGAPKLRLSDMIGLGDIGGQLLTANIQQIGADIDVMQLLMASAIIAGDGKQIALDLKATVPGLLSVIVDLAVGEPPQNSQWFNIGAGGELVRTAQTRLSVVAEVGGLLGVRVRIPLYLELAFAEARLKSVSCPTGRSDSARVTVDARPGVANLYIAEVDKSKIGGFANPAPRSPATILHVPILVTVTGEAHAEVSNMAYRPLVFTASDIAAGTIKQISTDQFTQSLTKSLLSSISLDVKPLGGILSIGIPSNLTSLLGNILGAATPALDGVLSSLLSTLGVSLGQADVRVHGATCGRAVLVQ